MSKISYCLMITKLLAGLMVGWLAIDEPIINQHTASSKGTYTMNSLSSDFTARRPVWLMGILIVSLGLLLAFTHMLHAAETAVSDLSESQKSVNLTVAEPGDTLLYTIFLTNTGISAFVPVTLTDVLPAGLIYQDSTFYPPVNGLVTGMGYATGVITWTGTLGPNGYVQIDLLAQVDAAFPLGESITNTAVVLGMSEVYSLTATTFITYTPIITYYLHLPVILKVIPATTLAASTPTPDNEWTLSWGALEEVTGYELQEANTPDFADATSYFLDANVTSYTVQHPPSLTNVYYYRIRGLKDGVQGVWSNTVQVVGATLQTVLAATRPNSNNQWTISWQPIPGVTAYELQESQTADFASPTIYTLASNTSTQMLQKPLTWSNVYHYRIRGMVNNNAGPWSEPITVIGGYRDDFDNPGSGWAVRRSSYREKTFVLYGTGANSGNLIALVDDRWDWFVASPLAPAPQVPYVIEYRSRVHDAANLVSGGISLGGDWAGDACPDPNNFYTTNHCFNHFYNFNYIFYGPIKLLFERVDQLYWCPTCGGSLLKRLGNIGQTWPAFDVLANGPSLNWHTYRVEVREDGIRLFIDGAFKRHFATTNYIHEPYFGVFASTDEYKPSIWFFDYYEVRPLD